jgi:hypothetical protein
MGEGDGMSQHQREFRCPRCGGPYFGTVIDFDFDDSHPPIRTAADAVRAWAAGLDLMVNRHLVTAEAALAPPPTPRPGVWVNPDTLAARLRRGEEVIESARVVTRVYIATYRCHNTADGRGDVTEGAVMRIEYGTHAIFPGAKGVPCGWEGTPQECGMGDGNLG